MRFLLISLLVVGTVAVSKEGSDDFEHHFLDVRQLVKGTIDAVAQLPEASKKNTTKKEPEDLYRFLQLPADILTQLASEAGYIEEMPTSTYGPILKTTTKSGIVSGDAGGSFRQMSESEEESIQEENEHRDAEEKRKREEKEREETERREKEDKEEKEKAEEENKRDEEKKRDVKETEEKKERKHHAPIVLQQNFDPSALSTTHAPSFPSLDFSALGLPNLFGQPATVAPPVLPPLPQGLPQPQYAYQPIVQPDGSTLYQQVLILPSSVPFKGPLTNETKIENPPIVTSTVAPATEEAFKSETEASSPKSDIHKIRKKKFKINAAKTLTMDSHSHKHRDVESEEKKSVDKKESEKETGAQEKSVEKEEGVKKKKNYSHELDKEVIKGNTHLITTVLPSFEEQQRIAQVFEEEYQTHKPLKGVLMTHKIESSSPLRIRSIPTRLGDNKYMKLFRQSPILERGAQDDTPDEESLRKKRKGRRKEIRRREEKKTFEMTTEEPSTTTTEESTTTTERSTEMTSSEERSTHPPRQMKKLSITRRIMPMDDEPLYTKNPKIRRRIISRKQEETSEAVNAFTQDMSSHSTESSIEVTTEAATTTTEEPMTTKKMKKMRKVRRRKIKTTTQSPSTTTQLPEEDVAFQEEEIVSSKEVIPTAPQANPPPMSFQNAMGELDDLIDPKRIMSKAEKYAALQEKLDETAKEKESDEKSMEKIKKEMSEEKEQTSRGEEERENIRDAEKSMETTTEKPEEQTTQTVKHKKLRKRRKLRKSTTTTTSTVPPTTTQETLVVTRQHCMNIRSFAFQFGMEDPTDFALMHCSFIENYYPTLTCDRAEEYMVYCREYYK